MYRYRVRADEAGLERLDLSDVVGARLERLAADPVVEAREDVRVHVVALVDTYSRNEMKHIRTRHSRSQTDPTRAVVEPGLSVSTLPVPVALGGGALGWVQALLSASVYLQERESAADAVALVNMSA